MLYAIHDERGDFGDIVIKTLRQAEDYEWINLVKLSWSKCDIVMKTLRQAQGDIEIKRNYVFKL